MARWKPKRFLPLRSGLERNIKDQLDEAGIKWAYEPEKIEYRKRVIKGVCPGCNSVTVYQRHNYTPDFVLANGIRIEVKGRLTSADRSKLIAVKSQHPDLDLRMVFGANNKLQKNKEERYSNWAAKNNIKFCIKTIPESWLK